MRNFTTSLQLITATAMLTATGCTPAIYTNIQKSYPARTEESPVLVYDLADTVPAPAQTLGSVWIKDSGFSTGCSYENIIRLAKNETNKIGGNGLHVVWHKKPAALGKSCHQISADMLLLPDSVYTASYARNAEAQQVRIAQYSGTPEIVPADKTDPERKKVNPRYNILHASAGYSMLTSEFKFPRNCDGDPKHWVSVDAGYQWISRIGLGVGIRYTGHFTSGKQRYVSMDSDYEKLNISLHYIAPEIALYQNVGRRWTFHESVGIGYMRYFEGMMHNTESIGGFGVHGTAGVNYRIKPWLGIGAHVLVQHARFDPEKSRTLRQRMSKDNTTMTHISFNGGLSFYFF